MITTLILKSVKKYKIMASILSRILAEDTIRVILDYFGYKELLIRFWLRGKLVVDYRVKP